MAQTLAVETHGLTKRYRTGVLAVSDLNLSVRTGEVYGFLGPNGAGKTTTLRMLSGLLHPTSGTAVVAGASPGSPLSLTRMGAMVETPAFYPYLSGLDNLRVVARYGGVPASRIDPALEQVDMTDRARHKFKTYSTGMKQRLGVASALLKDPQLLILDEPTSGLDPQGTVEMRELIKDLRQGGRTVLLSSHLLNEVELTCDRVGVIARGSLLAGLVLLVYALLYLVVKTQPASLRGSQVPASVLIRQIFPENFIPTVLSTAASIGAAIMIIFGALSTASEYGWSTVQTILIQKPGRTAVLGGKGLALFVATVLISIAALAVSALSAYVVVTVD